jgi:putative ABC transport system ATP-binding protein
VRHLTPHPDADVASGAPSRNGRRPVPDDAPPEVPAVQLRGLGRVFGSDPPVVALRGVDLVLERGTSLAILGPSGSGKSTLLNVLGCLDRQTCGTYRLDGIDVGGLSDAERAVLRAQRIGFVFQTFNLLAHRPVIENVMLAEVYSGTAREGREERALRALERVGMTHRARFEPTRLSGGEQQRVAIARALLGDPTIMLCDEPTGNLDSVNTRSVLALFDELGALGLTVAIVTHEDEVAAHAGRRVRIIDGELSEDDA